MEKKAKLEATLALADGTVFRGHAFGAERGVHEAVVGEVVFNTSMFGYQEILTDPSYAGQILTFTYPHIGNVGCNPEDEESFALHAEGLIIRETSKVTSNFRAKQSLENYLAERNKMGLANIDTRELVRHLRDNGSQMGAIACGKVNPDDLISLARKQGGMEGKDYVKAVTCKKAYNWKQGLWSLNSGYRELTEEQVASRPHVVAIDCGIKFNILRLLVAVGFRVTVVPATSTSQEISALRPDALFLSNGPGDPAALPYIVKPVSELLGKLPIFGICLGHQILGLAFGGKTFKLKFGHRGGNHPVRDETTKKVEITVQNHGFAVAADSLPKDIKISHINLNDMTVEGMEAPQYKAFCVQYHPESSPGPHDARYLFTRFFEMVVN